MDDAVEGAYWLYHFREEDPFYYFDGENRTLVLGESFTRKFHNRFEEMPFEQRERILKAFCRYAYVSMSRFHKMKTDRKLDLACMEWLNENASRDVFKYKDARTKMLVFGGSFVHLYHTTLCAIPYEVRRKTLEYYCILAYEENKKPIIMEDINKKSQIIGEEILLDNLFT